MAEATTQIGHVVETSVLKIESRWPGNRSSSSWVQSV